MGKGGGQQQQPTSTTAYQTNLPEYARPYVETMLGATQKQLFNTQPTAEGGTEITGFKNYQPYSANPQDYVAGFSPLQQQAQSGAANLQMPGEYGQAAGLAGLGSMASLGAGRDYQRMATNPYAMQAYMNPYVSASLQPQLREIQRQGDLAGLQAASQATAAGAFGGTRGQLAQAEAQRAAMNAQQQAIAQGYNTAYGQAQQAQQFGANLGLQGYGQALQGAGQLAGIGGQQLQAQQGIIGTQAQQGAAQQAQQQNIINQAIQDYATSQQYPLMQLGFMSNILRGLPMQSTTTQTYQAQPSTTQQLIGLGGTAAMLGKGTGMFKAGGKVEHYDVGGGIKAKAEKILEADPSGDKLRGLMAASKSQQERNILNEVLSGISAAPTGELSTNLATGGIIPRFDKGGEVERFADTGAVSPWDRLRKNDEDPDVWLSNAWFKKHFEGAGGIPALAAKRAKERENAKYVDPEFAGMDLNPTGVTRPDTRTPAEKRIAEELDRYNAENYYAAPNAPATPASAKESRGLAGTATAGDSGTAGAGAGATRATGYPSGLEGWKKAYYDTTGIQQGPGEKNLALMKALEERQAKMGSEADSDRYLRAAQAFAQFGSTPGPFMKGAAEALGGFAKGEVAAKKEQDKMALEGMKMQADLEAARDAKARGDFESYTKHMDSAEQRATQIKVAQINAEATKSGHGIQQRAEADMIERVMKEKGVDYTTALQMVRGAGKNESIDMQIATKAYTAAQASVAPGNANSKQYRELMKKDPALARKFVEDLAQEQIQGIRAAMGYGQNSGASSGNVLRFDAKGNPIQ